MTDKGSHGQEMDKEVQHSKTQAEALALRGVGQRALHRSADRLSNEQAVLFARMRDEGTKVCVVGLPELASDDPAALNAFLSARLTPGRSVTRTPDFAKMPRLARATAMRSVIGGHFEWVAAHPDKVHHYYGLTESGLSLLTQHQATMMLAPPRPKPVE